MVVNDGDEFDGRIRNKISPTTPQSLTAPFLLGNEVTFQGRLLLNFGGQTSKPLGIF